MIIAKMLIAYLMTALVFFAIDIVWLGIIAKKFYASYLGNFLNPEVNWVAAIVFYLIFIIGISFFAIYPAVEKESFLKAILYGALFGFFTYATYDLTNYATLKDWPLTVVIVDIIWGSFLTASVSLAGFYIHKAVNTFIA